MEVGGTAELRSWILSFGSGAEVLEPASLRAEAARDLETALARYRRGSASRKRGARRGSSAERRAAEQAS
jgi:hypothetical protein